MKEHKGIEQHLHEMAKKSGLSVPVSIVERTATGSAGCFKGNECVIEFSIVCLEQTYKHQQERRNNFPSLLHLADIIMAHELGHAKDQLLRNFATEGMMRKKKIWEKAMCLNKRALKTQCKAYATYNDTVENMAWFYANEFFLLDHDKETLTTYKTYCLQSYTKFYPFMYRLNGYSLRVMALYRTQTNGLDNQYFMYDLEDENWTSVQEDGTLHLNVIRLRNQQTTAYQMAPSWFMFLESAYHLAKKHAEEEDDALYDNMLVIMKQIKQMGLTEEVQNAIEEDIRNQQRVYEKMFQWMREHVNDSPQFERFCQAKRLEHEEELTGHRQFFVNYAKKQEKRKEKRKEKISV